MSYYNTFPLENFPFGGMFQTALPDFILSFAFFTALAYAVLGKRFDHQRSAVAASAAIGFALSTGLVWWERQAGLSIKSLGPVAVGFAVVVLAGVMYQAIRQIGGGLAGAGIALGASLLVAWTLGTRWPVAEQIVQTIITVALIIGILAFFSHHRPQGATAPAFRTRKAFSHADVDVPPIQHDEKDLQESHILSDLLGRRMQRVEKETVSLDRHPRDAEDILLQLKRMLPAEGYLTERMARLREKAYRMRQGHVARIEEVQHIFKKLPPDVKRKAAQELVDSYKELGFDLRLERLDRAVAANEKHIRDLTQEAQACLASHDYPKLHAAMTAARKLQQHNSHLFRIMDRAEARLEATARRIAKESAGVTRA